MKYAPSLYARAFVAASESKAGREKLVENLIALVRKNGDAKDLSKIAEEAARLWRAKEGLKKFTIESARPLSETLHKSLRKLGETKDVFEEKVDPAIVAGVRVTVDDERRFDATLAKKLQKMFGA